jgi:hypothetical protein
VISSKRTPNSGAAGASNAYQSNSQGVGLIQSFSGAHPFRPQCLVEGCLHATSPTNLERGIAIAQVLVESIDSRSCPRCGAALPTRPELPAGSRVTSCRCIPICGRCGQHEAFEGFLKGDRYAVTPPTRWPIRQGIISRDVNRLQKNSTPSTITLNDLRPADSLTGWAEFGYDDTQDREERER